MNEKTINLADAQEDIKKESQEAQRAFSDILNKETFMGMLVAHREYKRLVENPIPFNTFGALRVEFGHPNQNRNAQNEEA